MKKYYTKTNFKIFLRIPFIIIVLFLITDIYSQCGWIKYTRNAKDWIEVHSIQKDKNENLFITYEYRLDKNSQPLSLDNVSLDYSCNGNTQNLVTKIKPDGTILWTKNISCIDYILNPWSTSLDKKGNMFYSMLPAYWGLDSHRINVMDTDGNLKKVIALPDSAFSIYGYGSDKLGNFYLLGVYAEELNIGNFHFTTDSYTEIFLAKYDSTYTKALWVKTIKSDYANTDFNGQFLVDDDGNCYIEGSFNNYAKFDNILIKTKVSYNDSSFVAKIDKNGVWKWANAGASGNLKLMNQNLILKDVSLDCRDVKNGKLKWKDDNVSNIYDIVPLKDNSLLGYGYCAYCDFLNNPDIKNGSYFFVKIDSLGVIKESVRTTYGLGGSFPSININVLNDNSVIIADYIQSGRIFGDTKIDANPGYWVNNYDDIFIAKLNPNLYPIRDIKIKGDTSIFCSQSSQLNLTSGANGDTYNWTPLKGLNNYNIANPIFKYDSTVNYACNIKNGDCSINQQIKIRVKPLTVKISNNIDAVCSKYINLYTGSVPAISDIKYKWYPEDIINNPDSSTAQVDILKGTFYKVKVLAGNCSASDSITLNPVASNNYSMCIASADSSLKKNVLYMNDYGMKVKSYYIYKQSNTGKYEKIGETKDNYFVDDDSEPDLKNNSYNVSIMDSCGFESLNNIVHQTMYATILKEGNNFRLNWTAYKGFNYFYYNIYRGTNKGNMEKIADTYSSQNTYLDSNPPLVRLYYVVEAFQYNGCFPTKKCISNVVDNKKLLSIKDNEYIIENINIINTQYGKLRINITLKKPTEINLELYDVLGRKAGNLINISLRKGNNSIEINTTEFKICKGIYMLRFKAINDIVVKKLIIN